VLSHRTPAAARLGREQPSGLELQHAVEAGLRPQAAARVGREQPPGAELDSRREVVAGLRQVAARSGRERPSPPERKAAPSMRRSWPDWANRPRETAALPQQ
jgi:hypothetical protein